jgi:uncharacterized membrane-anchored protein
MSINESMADEPTGGFSSKRPPDHPLRSELNHEIHARPSESLKVPVQISYLALSSDTDTRDKEWLHVLALAEAYGAVLPARPANHYSADLGEFAMRWERHAEFTRYTFSAPCTGDIFASTALDRVPAHWIESIPGRVLVATHGGIVSHADNMGGVDAASARWFDGNVLVGSSVGDKAAIALTDFEVRADGFSRFVVFDQSMTPRQAGRTIQRLLEIDTYRMMALLALPVARELAPIIQLAESDLSTCMTRLEQAQQSDESALLDSLTQLGARIERWDAQHSYRFSASAAYYELVQRRIAELREVRITGMQTFGDFTERRLAPAMNTCRTMARRQESLARRIARANQLLTTRVDISVERQNQALLESMNRRAKAQFKLQQTVEGLSVAAITYYVIGLIGYGARALHARGYNIDYEWVEGLSIPIVLLLIGAGTYFARHRVTRHLR